MPLISSTIPNLINGVSQQAPALRLATQAEEQVNAYSTVVNGLKKRPPRLFTGALSATIPDDIFCHTMIRGDGEEYELMVDNGDLKVFDRTTATEKTVAFPNGKGYLANADPKTGFGAVTVADFTFITNRAIDTALDSSNTQPTRANEALIYVRSGNYRRRYKILIDGVVAADYMTEDGSSSGDTVAENESTTVDTSNIARALLGGLGAEGGDPNSDPHVFFPPSTADGGESDAHLKGSLSALEYGFERYGNVIHLYRLDGGDFTITTEDGYGGQAMYAIKDTVKTFDRLPDAGPDGFDVKVIGGESNDQDHFYVQFDGTVWTEGPAQGVTLGFDASTMPHVLISEADGTFTFKEADWDDRVAGDEDVIPAPSFIGSPVTEVTLHRGRLMFLTAENLVSSKADDLFNFWRTTATALLDDDPLDIATNHNKVSLLRHATPWSGSLFLMSENTQFELSGDRLLTPKTSSLSAQTEFNNSRLASPVNVGRFLYFTADRGDYASLFEYFPLDGLAESYDANEVTNHVPAYIPEGVFKITGSSSESCLAVLSNGNRQEIYLYKFYWSGEEKLQSSWSRWTVEDDTIILNAQMVQSELRLVVKYADGTVAFETIPMDPAFTDTGSTYVTTLDRRVDETQLTGTYDANEDHTTFPLPYTAPERLQAVSKAGKVLVVKDVGDLATLTLSGDHTATEFFAGLGYETRYTFSEFFVRRDRGSSTVTDTDGRLQLRYLNLIVDATTDFRVEVTPKGRKTYTYDFKPRKSADPSNVSGSPVMWRGPFKVPLMSKSEGLLVEIVNDSPFPSNFLSASWTALYVRRTRSI